MNFRGFGLRLRRIGPATIVDEFFFKVFYQDVRLFVLGACRHNPHIRLGRAMGCPLFLSRLSFRSL